MPSAFESDQRAVSTAVSAPPQSVPDRLQDSNAPQLQAGMIRIQDVDEDLKRRWLELEQRTVEGNVFLSPHFVEPAMKHLTPDSKCWLIYVEQIDDSTRPLRLAGVFEERSGNKVFPLKHLYAYRSPHSFASGVLLDKSHSLAAMTSFFDLLTSRSSRWHGLAFRARRTGGLLDGFLQQAADRFGLQWTSQKSWVRAAAVKSELTDLEPNSWISSSQRKQIRKFINRIERQGQMSFRFIRPEPEQRDMIDKFLELENEGWRGDSGDSLLSSRPDTEFFYEMAANLASERRTLICEMSVDDEIVFSSSMFQSGNDAVAFKVGWNTEWRKCGPGFIQQAEVLRQLLPTMEDDAVIDSCCQPGAWCDRIYPSLLSMSTGVFPLGRMGKSCHDIFERLRTVKHWLSDLRTGADENSDPPTADRTPDKS